MPTIANTGPISVSPSLLHLYYRYVTGIFQGKCTNFLLVLGNFGIL